MPDYTFQVTASNGANGDCLTKDQTITIDKGSCCDDMAFIMAKIKDFLTALAL